MEVDPNIPTTSIEDSIEDSIEQPRPGSLQPWQVRFE